MVDAPRTVGNFPEEKAAPDKLTDGARRATESVRDTVQDAAARGTALAGEVAAHVKDDALAAAEQGKEQIAGRLEEVASAVHRSGEQLEGQEDWLAQLVERGADELAHLASTVRSNDLRGLLDKLQDLARRQPVLFVGAAMAAGFASARLGKVAISGASRSDPARAKEAKNGPQ
ncbi:hypothetical protein ACFPL7_15930 [Dongia soli]|uniref:Nutrient deprivation-induced protein n=1 Tax=Dongia soli TaxID=600628 RepID=A0ABU5ECS1_9PROT|nr:hypothetical protein [Dongia soli]MDY0883614.1 hypothetical protein [Dongia soli]